MLRPVATVSKPLWSHPEFRAVVGMTLAAIGLALWHVQAAAVGRSTLVERGVRAALTPLQLSFAKASRTVADVCGSILSAGALAREKRELQEECDRLRAENQRLKYLHFEASRRMREQLGLPDESGVVEAPAVVIAGTGARPNARLRIWFARGYDVREADAVCTAAGLVGCVETVEGSTAWIRLITHPDSHVAAFIERTGELGIVSGPGPDESEDLLRMDYLYRGADVRVGDVVLTSGRGGIYPKGLRIGTVKSIVPAVAGDVSVAALVEPAADVRRVEYVRIVRRPE